jgi:uncharacterized protein
MFDLEKTMRLNLLLDFYGSLLTEKQRETIELYIGDDLSLAEIANEFSVSRNAVYDNLTRTIKQLENYENKLNLLKKFNARRELYDKIETINQNETINEIINELRNLE